MDGFITIEYMKAVLHDIEKSALRRGSDIPFISPSLRSLQVDEASQCRRPRKNTLEGSRRRGLTQKASKVVREIVSETLWPTRCAICDSPGSVLCETCTQKLKYVDVVFSCPRCGSPNGIIQCCECNDLVIDAIGLDGFPFEKLASAVVIDSDSKRLVTLYKDHDEHRLIPIIAKTMCRYINPAWLESKDDPENQQMKLTFIPSSADALRKRGFDHMEMIAKTISKYAHIELVGLFKRPKSEDQRKLNRKERVENMREKFKLRDGVQLPSRVLIIDDICTTGSTMLAAACCLKENGCDEVFGLTFGKVC